MSVELVKQGGKVIVRDNVRKQIDDYKKKIPKQHHKDLDDIIKLEKVKQM